MEKIFSQLNLSEESTNIYINSLGKGILLYHELKTILPETKIDDFNNSLNELLNIGLLIQVNIEKDITQTEFLAIPPYNPLLEYFKNIETGFSEIRTAIDNLIVKRVYYGKKISDHIPMNEILDFIS